jgi:N-acetylglucosaminyl-diphospho-decaprenol L-rhamnosyltransferase
MNNRLGIIIVNYNTFTDTCLCVESILSHAVVDADSIVIVDNRSPDGSGKKLAEKFPHLKVILSDRNGGYAYGVNLGTANLTADFCLVLNPDTRFFDNKIGLALDQFSKDPKLGVLGLHLEYANGSHQDSARRFFSMWTILLRRTPLGKFKLMQGPLNEHLMTKYWENELFEADWVTGAAFIVRRTAFDAIHGMDEGYFLYLEDTDLCKRMWRAGWSVKAISPVRITHILQREAARSPFGKANRIFFLSMIRYMFKFGIPIWGHGSRN